MLFRSESFREAVDHFLEQERGYVDEEIDYINEHTPFRREDS